MGIRGGLTVVVLFFVVVGNGLVIPANDPLIRYSGRIDYNTYAYEWPGIEFSAGFIGTSVAAIFNDEHGNMYNVFIDQKFTTIINTTNKLTTYPLATGLPNAKHTVLITKRTEAFYGFGTFHGFVIDDGASLYPLPPLSGRRIEFIGDSITCGFGVDGVAPCPYTEPTENNYDSHGPVTARLLNADYTVAAWSGIGLVHNSGDKNVTSVQPLPVKYPYILPGNLSNPWNFSQWVPQAVVINLGTNDFGGTPAPTQDEFQAAYVKFIGYLSQVYNPRPKFFLVCGPMESSKFCPYTENVATQLGQVYVSLEGLLVDGDWGCDGHPGVSGAKKMANATAAIIAKTLSW